MTTIDPQLLETITGGGRRETPEELEADSLNYDPYSYESTPPRRTKKPAKKRKLRLR